MAMSEQYLRTKQAMLLAKKKEKEMEVHHIKLLYIWNLHIYSTSRTYWIVGLSLLYSNSYSRYRSPICKLDGYEHSIGNIQTNYELESDYALVQKEVFSSWILSHISKVNWIQTKMFILKFTDHCVRLIL